MKAMNVFSYKKGPENRTSTRQFSWFEHQPTIKANKQYSGYSEIWIFAQSIQFSFRRLHCI